MESCRGADSDLAISFLQRQADARGLHSSPTPRSSDLVFRPVPKAHESSAWRCPTASYPGPTTQWGDRKSTRLHSQISYAVFCLNKNIIKSANPVSTSRGPYGAIA